MTNPENRPNASTEQPTKKDVAGAAPAHPAPHESELFPAPVAPRYFGTGDYDSGGTHVGNYAVGDVNRQGGYGTFTDAGGPGGAALLGEEPSEEEPGAEDEPERK